MQDAPSFQHDISVSRWQEEWPTLLAAMLFLLLVLAVSALIWGALHSPDPLPPVSNTIQVLRIIPPEPPPAPIKKSAPRQTQTKPMLPVPPKVLIKPRQDSIAAPSPVAKAAPPAPKTRFVPAAQPLSLDEPPDWRQAAPPQGANTGYLIGGDGDNGGGSGCGGANLFLSNIASQLQSVVADNEKTDSRNFQVRAELWFDDAGNVRRSQLLRSTGDADLDATVSRLLNTINAGGVVPQCLQPVTVWISQPWTGDVHNDDDASPSHVTVWRKTRFH